MPPPADYVDVADRIRMFKSAYPDGSLQSFMPPYVLESGGKAFVVYAAAAYRTQDDQRPGIGWAWEPVPGPTPFTRDSELMNAETSAWGRAIVALGFETKHVASSNEVRNRQQVVSKPAPTSAPPAPTPAPASAKVVTAAQVTRLWAIVRANQVTDDEFRKIVTDTAGVDSTKLIPAAKYDAVIAAVEARGVAA